MVMDEVYIAIDPETDKIMRRPDGAPVYGFGIDVSVVWETAEDVIKPPKAERK